MNFAELLSKSFNNFWGSFADPVFCVVSMIIIAASLSAILTHSLIRAALFLMVSFFSIAILYFYLGAFFVGMSQVLVYAIGVTLIMLFAIMLTNNAEESPPNNDLKTKSFGVVSAAACTGLFVLMASCIAISEKGLTALSQYITHLRQSLATEHASVSEIGEKLIQEQLLSFELISLTLLIVFISAIVIAQKKS